MGNIYDANGSYFNDGLSDFDNGLNFDAAANTVVRIRETENLFQQSYTAGEFGVSLNRAIFTGVENYAQYIDLLQYVPQKFQSSLALQQFLAEAGLMAGTWLGDISDLSLLVDPYNVDAQFITYLAGLIGFSFQATSNTTFAQLQRQLLQAISWYKMKGTYLGLKYIGYVLGLNLQVNDLYTQDYINFTQESWYTGLTGTLPPDATLTNPPFVTPSYSTLTIGTGTQNLIVGTGLTFATNQNIAITYNASNYMIGTLTSYNSTSGAMVVNVTNAYGSGTYAPSLLVDGGFELWNSISVLTDWSIGSGSIIRSNSPVHSGSFSCQTASNTEVYQACSNYVPLLGQTVTFGAWIQSSTANQAYIEIVDSTGNSTSATHPGDGQWHYITVTRTISSSATSVTFELYSGSGVAYFDGAVAYNITTQTWTVAGGYYKSPHFGVAINLTQSFGTGITSYLFDGANTYNQVSSYVNQFRPVNTVPQYSLLLTAETVQNGVTTTLPGNIKTATTSAFTFPSEAFNDGTTKFDDPNDTSPEFFFDLTQTGFYDSIVTWKLGTGNKGVDPSSPGFALQQPVPGLTGTMSAPAVYSDHVAYTIVVPNTVTQANLSELGLYLSNGTLEIGCTFPNISIVAGLQLTISVLVYYV